MAALLRQFEGTIHMKNTWGSTGLSYGIWGMLNAYLDDTEILSLLLNSMDHLDGGTGRTHLSCEDQY